MPAMPPEQQRMYMRKPLAVRRNAGRSERRSVVKPHPAPGQHQLVIPSLTVDSAGGPNEPFTLPDNNCQLHNLEGNTGFPYLTTTEIGDTLAAPFGEFTTRPWAKLTGRFHHGRGGYVRKDVSVLARRNKNICT